MSQNSFYGLTEFRFTSEVVFILHCYNDPYLAGHVHISKLCLAIQTYFLKLANRISA